MDNHIAGKVIVITGASSGLGESAARHLAAKGAMLVLGARRIERIQVLAEALSLLGGKALAVQTDVTQRAQVQRLVDTAVEAYGRVDVLLNNAGLMPSSPLERLAVDDWDRMIDVNIKGVLYGIAAALPYMARQQGGHIINVSSVAGLKVPAGGTVYSATKHAVRAITEGLRQEVTGQHIRTTVVCPGAVATELVDSITDTEVQAGMRAFYQIAISPDAFARAVAYAIEQPAEVDVNEVVFRPAGQVF